jgi:hypothetical protein
MKRVDHYLTEAQVAALKALSEQTGLSLSDLLRRAVDLYLKEQK